MICGKLAQVMQRSELENVFSHILNKDIFGT